MNTSVFATPWYVAGLRRFAALMDTIAGNLDRAFKSDALEQSNSPTEYERILARAAEESLADTRYRLTRYY